MAWIEFHGAKIKRLKKFTDMKRELRWSTNEALGFLGSFWGEVIELSEDGDISKWSPEYLCDLTETKLNPERVWQTLVRTGWIDMTEDGLYLIHDWMDTAGRFLEIKYKNYPDKLKAIQLKHSQKIIEIIREPLEHPKGSNQPDQPNQPDLTVILSQNGVLLNSFNSILQEKVKVYLSRVANKNKSKVITEGRKNTLLNELSSARSLCNNDQLFGDALEAAIQRDACCVEYVNAVIKNKKTQKKI